MLPTSRMRSQRQVELGQGVLDQVLGGVDVAGQQVGGALERALAGGEPRLEVEATRPRSRAAIAPPLAFVVLHRRPHPRRLSPRRRDRRAQGLHRGEGQRTGRVNGVNSLVGGDGGHGVLDGRRRCRSGRSTSCPGPEDAEQVVRVLPGEPAQAATGAGVGRCSAGDGAVVAEDGEAADAVPPASACARPAPGGRRRRTCRGGSGRSARRGARRAGRRPSTSERSAWPSRRVR